MIDMISMKTNKVFVSNVSVYRQSQLQVEGKLYIVEIEYFGEDIGMHRNVDFIL